MHCMKNELKVEVHTTLLDDGNNILGDLSHRSSSFEDFWASNDTAYEIAKRFDFKYVGGKARASRSYCES